MSNNDSSDVSFNFDDPEVWKKRGDEYVKDGKYEEAIKCYKEAIEMKPDYLSAWNNLGFAHFKLGHIDEAKKCRERINAINDSLNKLAKKDEVKSSQDLNLGSDTISKSLEVPVTSTRITERLPNILIISIIVGLLFALINTGIFLLFLILGVLAVYPIYSNKPDIYNITKICAGGCIILGVIVILTALSTDFSQNALLFYMDTHGGVQAWITSSSYNVLRNIRDYLIGVMISLLISGFSMIIFGYEAYRLVKPKKQF